MSVYDEFVAVEWKPRLKEGRVIVKHLGSRWPKSITPEEARKRAQELLDAATEAENMKDHVNKAIQEVEQWK
jgi:hypothetical protein